MGVEIKKIRNNNNQKSLNWIQNHITQGNGKDLRNLYLQGYQDEFKKLDSSDISTKAWHKQLKNLYGTQKKKGILNLINEPIIK